MLKARTHADSPHLATQQRRFRPAGVTASYSPPPSPLRFAVKAWWVMTSPALGRFPPARTSFTPYQCCLSASLQDHADHCCDVLLFIRLRTCHNSTDVQRHRASEDTAAAAPASPTCFGICTKHAELEERLAGVLRGVGACLGIGWITETSQLRIILCAKETLSEHAIRESRCNRS